MTKKSDNNERLHSNVPPPLSSAAQEENERFLSAVTQELQQISENIALTVLIWGPDPESPNPVAAKRKEIWEKLRIAGFNAKMSEEISTAKKDGMALKLQEKAQAKYAHLIIVLVEGSPGASAEVHDFLHYREIARKMVIMIPRAYKKGYGGQSIAFDAAFCRKVYWYGENAIEKCYVRREAMNAANTARQYAAVHGKEALL
jgi:hypothetical protein